MIKTMLAIAGGILLARYSPRLWGRLRKAGKERRDVRNLAPMFHRCGLSPEITHKYLIRHITLDQWRTEANKASANMQDLMNNLVGFGASPAILDGYINGSVSREDFDRECQSAMGAKLKNIADQYKEGSEGAFDRWLETAPKT